MTVEQVTRSGDTATVTLDWSVDLRGHAWKHRTTAELVDQHDQWRVDWKPSLVEKSLTDGETLQVSTIKAERGDILGRDDAPIVVPRPVVRLGIDRTQVAAAAAPDSARQLATLLDIDPTAYADQVGKAGPKAFVAGAGAAP